MTKTLATFLGIVYALMGIAGLFDTTIVGTNGVFAADGAYGLVLVLVGAVLLVGVVTRSTRIAGLAAGTVLAIVALSGFLIAPGKGEMFGMLVNNADHWINLILGVLLAGTALFEGAPRSVASANAAHRSLSRYAQSRYARHASHA